VGSIPSGRGGEKKCLSTVKVKLSLCLNKSYAMKTFGWVEVQLHALLTSKLYGDEWSASRPGRFIPYTRWIGGWVSSRVRLDTVKKKRKSLLLLPAIERFEGRSADRMS